MSKSESEQRNRQRFSLAVRVSCMLVLAAILPLLITVITIEFYSRPTLINQASKEMETDAQTRTQLIDSYFAERMLASESVTRLLPIQKFLAGDTSYEEKAHTSLTMGHVRGSYYQNWSLFDVHGNLLMYYPTMPQKHGSSFILPNAQQQLQTSKKTLISDIFYNPVTNEAYIDIYVPVITSSYDMVGILRTTFDLHYIWKIVDDEAGANGSRSYAFILDENGVRIAATNPHPDLEGMTHSPLIFTATIPHSPALQQRIKDEDLYGAGEKPNMPVLTEPGLAQAQQEKTMPSTFQMVPANQHEMFQVAEGKTYTVPWTYYVLSPLKTIAIVADQQLQITSFIAALVLLLAILSGIFVGRRFALPIMRSIEAQQTAYKNQQHLSQLKDQFLINVSHELRTPLTEVYGYLELLLAYENQFDTATKTKFLKNAMSGCEELTLLVNNVLDAIHIDNGTKPLHIEQVAVMQAVKDVLEQFDPRTASNYTVHVQIAKTVHVEADAQQLRQVLRNLLSNAFKYAPPQTEIVISTGCDKQEHSAKARLVTICVKDQGPGIISSDIDLLFKKFTRLERDLSGSVRGTGLGLYISKQLVEAMGGSIWVESSGIPGEGSNFCFTLPAATDKDNDKNVVNLFHSNAV